MFLQLIVELNIKNIMSSDDVALSFVIPNMYA